MKNGYQLIAARWRVSAEMLNAAGPVLNVPVTLRFVSVCRGIPVAIGAYPPCSHRADMAADAELHRRHLAAQRAVILKNPDPPGAKFAADWLANLHGRTAITGVWKPTAVQYGAEV